MPVFRRIDIAQISGPSSAYSMSKRLGFGMRGQLGRANIYSTPIPHPVSQSDLFACTDVVGQLAITNTIVVVIVYVALKGAFHHQLNCNNNTSVLSSCTHGTPLGAGPHELMYQLSRLCDVANDSTFSIHL